MQFPKHTVVSSFCFISRGIKYVLSSDILFYALYFSSLFSFVMIYFKFLVWFLQCFVECDV